MSIITADEGFLGKTGIHDRLRFETKSDYPFVEGEKKSQYSIEAYFFIPASLQLNANSYPIDNFYANIARIAAIRRCPSHKPTMSSLFIG